MNKRKYTTLTLDRKKDVIDAIEKGKSLRRIAQEFGVSLGCVSSIKASKEALVNALANDISGARKRLKRNTPNDEVNVKVFDFVLQLRRKNVPITGPLLQEKALQIAEELELDNFKASNGWLECFKKRHNIQFAQLSGAAAETDLRAAEHWMKKIPDLVGEFQPYDVFSADESGFFYRLLPTKSRALKGETCKGGKLAKERLTVLFCCSATGEKLKPLVVGRAEKPRAFKHIKLEYLPVHWRANRKSLMTRQIFEDWLRGVNSEMKRQSRTIFLLVDDATSHSPLQLSNVKVHLAPSNLSSKIQPLDRGIVDNVKRVYRKNLIRKILAEAQTMTAVSEATKKVNVRDAVNLIHTAWQDVAESTISTCFKQAGIDFGYSPEEEPATNDCALPTFLRQELAEDYECFDNALCTCDNKESVCVDDCDGDSDEDAESTLEEDSPVSAMQALQHLDGLQRYALQKHPELLSMVLDMQQKVESAIIDDWTKKQQKSITEYFIS